MAEGKLTPEMQKDVLQWLCEGARNTQIVQRIQDSYGISVTQQAIDYYRNAYADRIDEARDATLTRYAQQGFANRVMRLRALESRVAILIDATSSRIDPTNEKEYAAFVKLNSELRLTIDALRDELGDLVVRHEVSMKEATSKAREEVISLLHHAMDAAGLPEEWRNKIAEAMPDAVQTVYGDPLEELAAIEDLLDE